MSACREVVGNFAGRCGEPATHVVVLPQGVLDRCERHASEAVRYWPRAYTVSVPS